MNLADPSELKQLLSRHGLWASKGLGQHFLVSTRVVDAIAAALQECKGILEIGPGPGVLTSVLSVHSEKMIAIELDSRMQSVLAESAPLAEILVADAMVTDLAGILSRLPEPRGVVSNLPYYITGPLITRIAEQRKLFSKAVLMMQKEVAERVLAAPKSSARGSLSVYLQMQFEIKMVSRVPAGAFLPPPKVDSAVLELVPKSLPVAEEESGLLFRLIRTSFAQPRKTLENNLIAAWNIDREEASHWIERTGLKEKVRPQELSNDEWVQLFSERRKGLMQKGEDTPE